MCELQWIGIFISGGAELMISDIWTLRWFCWWRHYSWRYDIVTSAESRWL